VRILTQPGATNVGYIYFASDGNGTLTNVGSFHVATPPGFYSVSLTGAVTVTVDSESQTNTGTSQFMPPRQIVPPASSSNVIGISFPVQDASSCAGHWEGTLSETNDPDGLSDYSLNLTVAADGSVNVSGDFSGTGWIFALAPTNGASIGFFNNTLYPMPPFSDPYTYDEFRITVTLNGNVISGTFNTDSVGSNAILGTVYLTR
jgi:hypothetical protein